MIICYTVPEIRLVADVSVTLHFGLIFALLPHPDSSKNQNSKNKQKKEKKGKKYLEKSSSYAWVPNIIIRRCTVLEI